MSPGALLLSLLVFTPLHLPPDLQNYMRQKKIVGKSRSELLLPNVLNDSKNESLPTNVQQSQDEEPLRAMVEEIGTRLLPDMSNDIEDGPMATNIQPSADRDPLRAIALRTATRLRHSGLNDIEDGPMATNIQPSSDEDLIRAMVERIATRIRVIRGKRLAPDGEDLPPGHHGLDTAAYRAAPRDRRQSPFSGYLPDMLSGMVLGGMQQVGMGAPPGSESLAVAGVPPPPNSVLVVEGGSPVAPVYGEAPVAAEPLEPANPVLPDAALLDPPEPGSSADNQPSGLMETAGGGNLNPPGPDAVQSVSGAPGGTAPADGAPGGAAPAGGAPSGAAPASGEPGAADPAGGAPGGGGPATTNVGKAGLDPIALIFGGGKTPGLGPGTTTPQVNVTGSAGTMTTPSGITTGKVIGQTTTAPNALLGVTTAAPGNKSSAAASSTTTATKTAVGGSTTKPSGSPPGAPPGAPTVTTKSTPKAAKTTGSGTSAGISTSKKPPIASMLQFFPSFLKG